MKSPDLANTDAIALERHPAPAGEDAARPAHRRSFRKLLGRVWVPLVVVLVVIGGGYTVSRLQEAAFSTDKHPRYADSQATDGAAAAPKQLVYEVFGTPGAVADINYFDLEAKPQQVLGAALPWSLTLTSAEPTVIGSIVAQGNSDNIGCRILVNGETKAEKISTQPSAFTYCLATGA